MSIYKIPRFLPCPIWILCHRYEYVKESEYRSFNAASVSFPYVCVFEVFLFLNASYVYSNGNRGGDGDFIAGFLLGGAVCGTLAYIFAPQVI